MAVLEMNYKSACLKRFCKIRIVLPFENSDFTYDQDGIGYKTLYLLHGFSENEEGWLLESPIFREARHRKLAVVMPSGENRFYLDDYTRLVGEELVQVSRKVLPLSHRKEDTFLAGNSMGGYGAVYVGLKYKDVFSKIVSFSGGFFEYMDEKEKQFFSKADPAAYEQVMKLFADQKEEDRLSTLIRKNGLPKICLLCGKQDPLLGINRKFHDELDRTNVGHIYEEEDGRHDFNYWGAKLPEALDWLIED